MARYYAVCNAGGPISVALQAETKKAALKEFAEADHRAWIDGCRTDIEDEFGLDGSNMDESEFDDLIRLKTRLLPEEDLDQIVNANAGTAGHLQGGWYLWENMAFGDPD